MNPPAEPAHPDQQEMDWRFRMTELEERVTFTFWLAIGAELGVAALALLLLVSAWRKGKAT